jgi:hypothetical protein
MAAIKNSWIPDVRVYGEDGGITITLGSPILLQRLISLCSKRDVHV